MMQLKGSLVGLSLALAPAAFASPVGAKHAKPVLVAWGLDSVTSKAPDPSKLVKKSDDPVSAAQGAAKAASSVPPPFCAKTLGEDAAWGKQFFHDLSHLDAVGDQKREHRTQWLKDEPREHFVTVSEDVGHFHKGEPLLVLVCWTTNGALTSYNLLSADYTVAKVDPSKVVISPAQFNLPAAPKEEKFEPHLAELAYQRATEADFKKVPGSYEMIEKRGRCQDSGIGAAQSSEKKVAHGVDYESRRKSAGQDAHSAAFGSCFGKIKAKYDADAQKLWALEQARANQLHDALVAKLK